MRVTFYTCVHYELLVIQLPSVRRERLTALAISTHFLSVNPSYFNPETMAEDNLTAILYGINDLRMVSHQQVLWGLILITGDNSRFKFAGNKIFITFSRPSRMSQCRELDTGFFYSRCAMHVRSIVTKPRGANTRLFCYLIIYFFQEQTPIEEPNDNGRFIFIHNLIHALRIAIPRSFTLVHIM